MKRINLDPEEKAIEDALLKGEYVSVDKVEFQKIAQAIQARRKDSVLNIRINSQDLKYLKDKAKKLGVKYQSFISEVLHRIAHE